MMTIKKVIVTKHGITAYFVGSGRKYKMEKTYKGEASKRVFDFMMDKDTKCRVTPLGNFVYTKEEN